MASHPVLSGALVGAVSSLFLAALDVPLVMLLVVPFIAGLMAGSAKNGAIAGMLSLVLSLLVLIPASAVLPSQTVNLPGDVSGIGIVGGTFAALTNGLLGSARATMGGFAALFSQLGQILLILVVLSMALMAGVGLVASAVVGAIGGLIGRPLRKIVPV